MFHVQNVETDTNNFAELTQAYVILIWVSACKRGQDCLFQHEKVKLAAMKVWGLWSAMVMV